MNFVLASDDNYVPFLSVTLASLIKNNKDNSEYINIYILNDNISEINKKRIISLIKEDNIKLEFIDTKLSNLNDYLLGMEKNNHISFTTYIRLFLASLLPKDIDKIIYLDCDAIVLGSFKEMWDLNLNDNYIGAVLDPCSTQFKDALGISANDKYFNAGVLLVNLKKWREDNIENIIVNYIKNNYDELYQHDQTIINKIFKDKITVIDPKFNLMGVFTFLDYSSSMKLQGIKHEFYSKEIIDEAVNNPVFIHLYGDYTGRPWSNKYHPHRKLYEKYIKLTDYSKDEIFKSRKIPLISKIYYKIFNYPKLAKSLVKVCPDSIIINRDKLVTDKYIEENLEVGKNTNKN